MTIKPIEQPPKASVYGSSVGTYRHRATRLPPLPLPGLAQRHTPANARNTTVTLMNQNFPRTLHVIATNLPVSAHVLLAKHHCQHRHHHKRAP